MGVRLFRSRMLEGGSGRIEQGMPLQYMTYLVWVGLDWIGLGWVGLGWVGLAWVQNDWKCNGIE